MPSCCGAVIKKTPSSDRFADVAEPNQSPRFAVTSEIAVEISDSFMMSSASNVSENCFSRAEIKAR